MCERSLIWLSVSIILSESMRSTLQDISKRMVCGDVANLEHLVRRLLCSFGDVCYVHKPRSHALKLQGRTS